MEKDTRDRCSRFGRDTISRKGMVGQLAVSDLAMGTCWSHRRISEQLFRQKTTLQTG